MKPVIYLDNQSTTKTDPEVVKDMLPYFDEHYGNSESNYHLMQLLIQDQLLLNLLKLNQKK